MTKTVDVSVALTRECYGTIELEVPDNATAQDIVDNVSTGDIEEVVSHKINGNHSNFRIIDAVLDGRFIIDNEIKVNPEPEKWIIVATQADGSIKSFEVPTPDDMQDKSDQFKLAQCTAILVEEQIVKGNALRNIVLGTKGPRDDFGWNAIYKGEDILKPDFALVEPQKPEAPQADGPTL